MDNQNNYMDPDLRMAYDELIRLKREKESEQQASSDQSPFTELTGTSKSINDFLTQRLYPLAMQSKEDQTPINLMERSDAPLRGLEAAGNIQDIPASYMRRGVYSGLTGSDKYDASGKDIIGALENKIGSSVPEMPGASLKMKDILGYGTDVALDPSIAAAAFPLIKGTILPKRPSEIPRIDYNPRMEAKEALFNLYGQRPALRERYGPKTPVESSPYQTTEDTEKLLEGEKARQQKMEELSSKKPTNPSEFWQRGETSEFPKPDFGKPYGSNEPKAYSREDMSIVLDKLKDEAITPDQAAEKLKRLHDVDDNNINNFLSKLFASKISTATTIPKMVKKVKENLDRSDPQYFNKLLQRTNALLEQKGVHSKGGIKNALLESED